MLHLGEEHRRAIARHGEGGYPEEVCGFLLGRWDRDDVKTVARLLPIDNAGGTEFAEGTRRRRFWIPPDQYYRADREARAANETILGFYHSHPDHPARPSGHDLALARETFPGYSYVIVAVHGAKAVDLTSWVLRDDGSRFDPETIADAAAAEPADA
jgi:proteasome lid subunit RPN8/RPN11